MAQAFAKIKCKSSASRRIPPLAVCGTVNGYAALLPDSFPGITKNRVTRTRFFVMVGEAGFGPAKSVTTDLQSAPFGRSGIPP